MRLPRSDVPCLSRACFAVGVVVIGSLLFGAPVIADRNEGPDAPGGFHHGGDEESHASDAAPPVARHGVDAVVRIASPADGSRVVGPDLPLEIALQRITLIPMGVTREPRPATLGGHLHVAVDGAMLGMIATASGLVVHDLKDGRHELSITLTAPDHRAFDPPIEARVRFTVTGSRATGGVFLTAVGPPTPLKEFAARLPGAPAMAALLASALAVVCGIAWKLTSRGAPASEDDRG
jgi:hypothetical protein